jgi:hypothetical protein
MISCQEENELVNDTDGFFFNICYKSFQLNIQAKIIIIIKTSNKGKWFIFFLSFKFVDMATFKASFNNQ